MENSNNLAKNPFSFACMAIVQASSSSVSYNYMIKFGSSPLVVQEIPSLNVLMGEEALSYDFFFLEQLDLVCRFNGFWPRLTDLHKLISKSWKPLLTDESNIYPMARGFFVVVLII